MKQYLDINAMVDLYIEAHNPTPNPVKQLNIDESNKTLKSLTQFDFLAFIYQLHTGNFTITRFSTTGFTRYFMAGTSHNLALDIANNIQYTKEDFINLLNTKTNK